MRKPSTSSFGFTVAVNVSPAPSVFAPPTRTVSATIGASDAMRMFEKDIVEAAPPVPPPNERYAMFVPMHVTRSTSCVHAASWPLTSSIVNVTRFAAASYASRQRHFFA